ncbi:MAG: arginine repressor [Francisellaceae bacterium]
MMKNLSLLLKELISRHQPANHKEIIQLLVDNYGFTLKQLNQSRISRLIHQIGAIKQKNVDGQLVYMLPHEQIVPSKETLVHEFILSIRHNESLVVIKTVPGAASVIARALDCNIALEPYILGTISGDDVVFVAGVIKTSMTHLQAMIEQELIP